MMNNMARECFFSRTLSKIECGLNSGGSAIAPIGILLLSISILASSPHVVNAQPEPSRSFLRSLAVPGWGHHYNNPESWTRGKIHLGADILLIGSYFGLSVRANNLEDQFETFAQLRSGVPIENRSRSFRLAIGQFSSLQEYNDFQLRSRNWNRLLPDVPENRWEWASEEDRRRYRDLRESSDNAQNQLPAIGALLVVNRVISAISAYRQARDLAPGPDIVFSPVINHGSGDNGFMANVSFRF